MTAQITVLGLGPGQAAHLSLAGWEVLKKRPYLFIRTKRHPLVEWLKKQGITGVTFDDYYETSQSFEEVYERIAQRILTEAEKKSLVYAVPGHPLVAEKSVTLILHGAKLRGIKTEIIPAMSFLDVCCAALQIDPAEGLRVVDGLSLPNQPIDPLVGNIIMQVYNQLIASEVKLTLLEYYPPEYPVKILQSIGLPKQERIEEYPLYFLDRLAWFDHLTSLYLSPYPEGKKERCFPLDPLVNIIKILRGERGCPWDKEQTQSSLIRYLLEETYEVVEAILEFNPPKISEELGDLLLQIVFQAQIAEEKSDFGIGDVITGITNKIIQRHPHVFGPEKEKIKDSADVGKLWEKIKAQEKGKDKAKSTAKHLPALLRARYIQEKAAKNGFDWPDYRGALAKVTEELNEVNRAIAAGEKAKIIEELGDLLFAVVNTARLLDIEAEVALTGTINKFNKRLCYLEKQARQAGKELSGYPLAELDSWWEEAKKAEVNGKELT
jgi:tetrapyrrole methylase family protein/MazG family protein